MNQVPINRKISEEELRVTKENIAIKKQAIVRLII
jgi:hypothetical protein